jgi:hypothetical protein
LIEVVLGIAQLGADASDRRVHAVDGGPVGNPRALSDGFCLRNGLLCSIEIASEGIECRLRDDPLFEQLGLPVVVLLRQPQLRPGFFDAGYCLVELGFELSDGLLGFRQGRLLLVDDQFVRLRVVSYAYRYK